MPVVNACTKDSEFSLAAKKSTPMRGIRSGCWACVASGPTTAPYKHHRSLPKHAEARGPPLFDIRSGKPAGGINAGLGGLSLKAMEVL
jgi:hypothetical protein